MRIRARNRLKGIIVTAAITNEAVDELGLKTRQEAYANVKDIRREGRPGQLTAHG